jgi:hypothetical protein
MCPACLAAIGLYVAGGVSAGGITTYVATKVLRGDWKRVRTPDERGDAR